MRIECLSLGACCGVNALLKTESFFLSRRVLLIRSVLFLSINPSELEKSCSLHFPSARARASFVYPQAGALGGGRECCATRIAHQQFIIILHCIQCFSADVIGSVFVLSNSFPPAATFQPWFYEKSATIKTDRRVQWNLKFYYALKSIYNGSWRTGQGCEPFSLYLYHARFN